MKKLILYLFALCSIQLATAQVSFNPKVAKGQGPSTNFQIDSKSIFTNSCPDSVFEWIVIDINATSGWEFGLCDPGNCVTELTIGSKSEFTLGVGKSGEFKGDFVPNATSGNGKAKIVCYSKANPTMYFDTLEVQINAWATGVKINQAATRELSIFPNPAKEKLTLKYNVKETTQVDIYNVLGSKVKTINHNGFETEINISDLQKGLYFIRFKDGNQTISKPFTKSE
jgi:hypothetical protein